MTEFNLDEMPIVTMKEPTSEPVVAPVPQLSEEQNALFVFQTHINTFIHKLNNYAGSKSQIARAWTNAAISPLNNDELHFSYPEQKELFDLFTELNSAKFILMVHGMVRDGKIEIKKPLLDSVESPSSNELNNMMETLGESNEANTEIKE